MTKNEILEGLHNRISEVISGGGNTTKDLGLKKIVNDALTESNFHPEMVKNLEPFDVAINENVNGLLLIRPLLETLSKYTSLYNGIKTNCEKLKGVINENLDDINLMELYESIENPDIKNFIGVNFDAYMSNKSLENKSALVGVLESASGYDKSTLKMLGYLKENSVVGTSNVINIYEDVNESNVIDFQGQKFVETADGRLRSLNVLDTQKIFEAVDEYVAEKIEESKNKKLEEANQKDYRLINNDLHLFEHIVKLQTAHPENEALQALLFEYASALQDGCREEMIYETFMNRLHEGFDYLSDVELAVENLKEASRGHKKGIEFVKAFEQMSNSSYAYLIPIIEGVVYDYVKNPNPQTRNILLNQLRMYESCPQVVYMMLYANEDVVISEGFNAKDVNKFIEQHAHTESVFSPIQYIRENECVFSVENKFYVKKGNNITKLSNDAINNLSESFIALSILVNDPHVEINEHEDKITYYTPNQVVEISENFVKIGDNYESLDELKQLVEMHVKYPEMDDVNILTSAFLLENFNNIAKVDFVTKIAMNENDNKTLDLFKIKENIFVASHDNINEEHTFYRNVKPLQLKNIINNHFGMNVSNLFEDLMPNQDKIVSEINELKNEYENKITSLMEMRHQFEMLIEENGETEELTESVRNLTNQINEAKKEYKKFQKKADEIENGKSKDNDSDEETAPVLNEKGGKKKPKKKELKEDEFDGLPDEGGEEIDGVMPDEEFGDDEMTDDLPDLDFDDDFSLDGSDDFDLDGSDFELDGSDDFDLDGSDFDFGSDEFESDDYTTSDGDDMTQNLNDFETDPFADSSEDNFAFDYSDANSQDDDYAMDDFEPESPESPELGDEEMSLDDESVLDTEDDPFGQGEGFVDDGEIGAEAGEVADAVTGEPEERTEQKSDDADLDYANFKIVKIDFDANVRTGERKSTGKAIVVVPWIDDFGNKTSETKTIPFYVTDIQGEKGVVLDTTGMTVEMYNAVTDAIKNSSDFETVEIGGQSSTANSSVEPEMSDELSDYDENAMDSTDVPVQEEPVRSPFDSGSDETTVLTIEDGIEPHGIDVATYSDGDTEIEMPANNIAMDGEEVGVDSIADGEPTEESPILDIMGESRRAKKGSKSLNESANSGYEHLFESVAAASQEIVGQSDNKLVTSETQEDPIAVIEDVLVSFAEEMGLDEDGEETSVEVGEIEDFDIDGTEVNSIKAFIGENEYAFFVYGDKAYSCLAEDFDEFSEDIESLDDFVESGDENLASCSTSDVHDIVELVTDVISIETGEDFEYEVEGDTEDDVELEESDYENF